MKIILILNKLLKIEEKQRKKMSEEEIFNSSCQQKKFCLLHGKKNPAIVEDDAPNRISGFKPAPEGRSSERASLLWDSDFLHIQSIYL